MRTIGRSSCRRETSPAPRPSAAAVELRRRRGRRILPLSLIAAVLGVFWAAAGGAQARQAQEPDESFRFRTGIELINVTATVTDENGRFVPSLTQDDFRIFEDGRPQTITHFSRERVPVSLGILLDTSGSMNGEKFLAARRALDRFLQQLLDPRDEIFLYSFDSQPELVEEWTTDRRRVSRAIGRLAPRGGTSLYDAVVEAVPMAQAGTHRKKAIVVISDGMDTSSRADLDDARRVIRGTEVLVYAIAVDGPGTRVYTRPPATRRPPPRFPFPFPTPRGRPPLPGPAPQPPQLPTGRGGSRTRSALDVEALRALTDDSGGRTEVIRGARDLDPATAGVADELSRQYHLGYPAPGWKDGRWHSIEVQVGDPSYRVRARRGYVAAP